MDEDGARGKDWLWARGHHLCLTDTIFYFFFNNSLLSKQAMGSGYKFSQHQLSLSPEIQLFNPVAFGTAKTQYSFGRLESNRIRH